MAQVQNQYVGDGATRLYSFTFPYIDENDIQVRLDNVATTEYTLANATTIEFNTAPGDGVIILIRRQTSLEQIAEFFPGSAIRAQDLNDNFTQTLYAVQEFGDGQDPDKDKLPLNGGTMLGPIVFSDNQQGLGTQVSPTPPVNAQDGDTWWDTVSGKTFVYYQDVDSSQWVVSSPDADLDAYIYPSGTARQITDRLTDYVSPKDFGAVGDGVADDTAALSSALQTGKPVDGLGLTYLITSTITVGNLKSFKNATVTYPDLGNQSDGQVLRITNGDFVLDTVKIIYGDSPLRTTSGPNGGLNQYQGVRVEGDGTRPSNFTLRDCLFTGDGSGTHVFIVSCDDFSVTGCHVYDSKAQDPLGTDDQLQAFSILNCSRYTISNSTVRNLLTYETRAFASTGVNTENTYTNINTRGFVNSMGSDYSVVGCHATLVDQGFDVTGSGVNTRWIFSACTAYKCGAIGFKAANGPSFGMFSDCIAKEVGLYSFLASSNNDLNDHDTARYISINNCKAIDAGTASSLDWDFLGNGSKAFAALAGDTSDTNFLPLRVEMHGCSVIQENSTVSIAFHSTQVLPDIADGDTFGDKPLGTVLRDCSAYATSPGAITTRFSGPIGPVFCNVGLGNSVDITSYAGSWFAIPFGSEISDSFNMHSTNNPERVYVREPGIYTVDCNVATSERPDNLALRLKKGGNEVTTGWASERGLDQGIPNGIHLSWTGYIDSPTFLSVEILSFFGNEFPGTTTLELFGDRTMITVTRIS
ncbi:tail fiber [Synechococcus T7-like virus S-TIP28]|uniref:Tail fiber n=1 Tax=Synechococcus T7-like virus S-TIP28 TaxID=1332140 RepID=A0AAE9BPF9_9CAUD|nr:tail fiber [Synechococcus T7-like virus S-TIP28]